MKLSTTRIERKRITDQIIDQFVSMIADGKLKPGDRLPPEHVLMRQFGVGRSSLREAIGALSLIGLLTVRPGHGTHVAASPNGFLEKPLSWSMLTVGRDKVHELVEARIALEHAIVGLAAERATQEEIAEIRHYQGRLKAAKKRGRRSIRADLSFHNALAKASHNSVLARLLSELRQPMRTWMQHLGDYDKLIDEHDAIVDAVEAHDVDRAQSAVRQHLESVGARLATALLGRQRK